MRSALILLVATTSTAAAAAADGQRWSRRNLARYVRARAGEPPKLAGASEETRGGADGGYRVWRGRGLLTNTLTGAAIAEVDCLERCRAADGAADADADRQRYESERILVFRNRNGTRLAPPLRYKHVVSLELDGGGHLMMRALDANGNAIASGWCAGGGGSTSSSSKRPADFELSVRPLLKDGARAEKPPESAAPPDGWPRVANRGAVRATREEYVLSPPGVLGRLGLGRHRQSRLAYRRVGKCPTWYGGGVCTLELQSEALPAAARRQLPWRKGRRRRTVEGGDWTEADSWEGQAEAMLRE